MSKTYRADFVPHGAYFFGNEKTFSFDTGGRSFISSEQTPSQSTLLGALRYALLYNFEYEGRRLFKPDRKYSLSDNEQAAVDNLIGKGGFDIGSSSEQDFGAIEKLSPLFIYDTKKAEALVPTPRDHCISDSDEFNDFAYSADSDNVESFPYAPFSPDDFVFDEFTFSVDGSDSGSQIPAHWLFQKVQRIGISKKQYKSAFFKRECYQLQDGFAFSVYVTLRDDVTLPSSTVVFMGQGRTAFTIRFTEEEDSINDALAELIYPDTVYLRGDSSLTADVYAHCFFTALAMRDHRAYSVSLKGKVSKGANVYHLISAGSIFKSSDAAALKACIESDSGADTEPNAPCTANLTKIGMNIAIIGKRKENNV